MADNNTLAAKPATKPAKKPRNYLIDVFKLISAVTVFLAHLPSMGIGVGELTSDGSVIAESFLNVGSSYFYMSLGPYFGWLRGYITLSFYLFFLGYWFMNTFKSIQRKGYFGKGKDLKLILRYFCKNYSSYWPPLIYGVIFGYLVYGIAFPQMFLQNPINIIHSFVNGIPEFLGIFEWVWSPVMWQTGWFAPFTNNLTDTSHVLLSFSAVYFLSMAIFALTVYFVIFTISEKFGATIWCFWMYSACCLTFGSSGGEGYYIFTGLGINYDFIRLMGPASLGIWGWYMADYLKKAVTTKKHQRNITLVAVLCYAVLGWWIVTGDGGMITTDIVGGTLFTIVMVEKDYITIAVNKFLNKLPFSKHISTIAMSIFLHHYPLVIMYGEMKQFLGGPDWLMSLSRDQLTIYGLILLFLLGVVYIFIDKYFVQRLSRWVSRITHAQDPVFTEEELAAIEASKG